jgi:hypothetical protein
MVNSETSVACSPVEEEQAETRLSIIKAATATTDFFKKGTRTAFCRDHSMALAAAGFMFQTLLGKGVFTQHECCVIHLSMTQPALSDFVRSFLMPRRKPEQSQREVSQLTWLQCFGANRNNYCGPGSQ